MSSPPWPTRSACGSSSGSRIRDRTSRRSATATLVADGVCVVFIADKLGVAQPTATTHLQALARAGLVTPKRVGRWTFYRRDERAIRELKRAIRNEL